MKSNINLGINDRDLMSRLINEETHKSRRLYQILSIVFFRHDFRELVTTARNQLGIPSDGYSGSNEFPLESKSLYFSFLDENPFSNCKEDGYEAIKGVKLLVLSYCEWLISLDVFKFVGVHYTDLVYYPIVEYILFNDINDVKGSIGRVQHTTYEFENSHNEDFIFNFPITATASEMAEWIKENKEWIDSVRNKALNATDSKRMSIKKNLLRDLHIYEKYRSVAALPSEQRTTTYVEDQVEQELMKTGISVNSGTIKSIVDRIKKYIKASNLHPFNFN